ncbi:MAG: heparinase II/III family protein [Clostridia bacterium]|nr:heparinase II/III family protein [Clostridia bacterium]
MLTEQLEKLRYVLPADYSPYPTAGDRSFWDNAPDDYKNKYIAGAEAYMEAGYPALKATLFMEFHRTGNRSNYQGFYSARRNALNTAIMAELFENKGRFIDFIIDLIWMICEETTWIIPAHNNVGGFKHHRLPLADHDRPIIDLMAADTGAAIALALHFFKDRFDMITPQISRRAEYELDRRLLKEYRDHTDYWWMGFMGDKNEKLNNWNPWINSNMLIVLLLTGQNPHERYYLLNKITQSLDRYLEDYPEDGGCDEGPGYWGRAGASMFECLEILHEYSGGLIDIYKESKIRNMCGFIRRAHIDGDYFVNFADAAPRAASPSALIYRFGKQIGDVSSMAFGVRQFHNDRLKNAPTGRFGINRDIRELSVMGEMLSSKLEYTPEQRVFLKDIEVAYMRSAASDSDIFLAAKGGNNLENHNHNDVGNFIVFVNGNPFIVDAGAMTYTQKTFSPQRYEIWTNQSQWHNVPEVNGVGQSCGYEYKAINTAFKDNGKMSMLSMDIQEAYPPEAGIIRWHRSFSLDDGTGVITVFDEYKLSSETNTIRLTLLSRPRPVINGNEIMLEASDSRMLISAGNDVQASFEEALMDDEKLLNDWGGMLYRISLHIEKASSCGIIETKFKLI